MRLALFDEVVGVMPQADYVEGRFGLLTRNRVATTGFGSNGDLPGFRVPATADEAKAARYCLTWAQTNQKGPYVMTPPAMDWSMREGGFDQANNTPFTGTIRTTWPGNQDNVTIPSGAPSLGYANGVFVIPSGQYIDNAALHYAGAFVIVANTAEDTTDAGKPKYQSSFDDRVIGTVEAWDVQSYELTVRTR